MLGDRFALRNGWQRFRAFRADPRSAKESSSHPAGGCRRWSRMTSDVHTEGEEGLNGWVGRFRADGDVEAFIEDDLRALDLRYLFTLFPRRHRGREGREGQEEEEGGRPEGPERVLLASRPWRLLRRTTHIVAPRKGRGRETARGSEREKETGRETLRKNRSEKGREEGRYERQGWKQGVQKGAMIVDRCVVLNLVSSFLPISRPVLDATTCRDNNNEIIRIAAFIYASWVMVSRAILHIKKILGNFR